MPLAQFLTSLLEDGRVVVPQVQPLPGEALAEGDEVLTQYERVQRDSWPGTPPEFDLSAGRWAGLSMFRACQFASYRDLGPADIQHEFGQAFSDARTPAAHYSVDLTLRYLPDLWRFAQTAADDDPLLVVLAQWAADWPISSVGLVGTGFSRPESVVSIDEFAHDVSLLQQYVDRIFATGDKTRLGDPQVQCLVRAALGHYPTLDARMNQALLQLAPADQDDANQAEDFDQAPDTDPTEFN